jgi:hypothetical protein
MTIFSRFFPPKPASRYTAHSEEFPILCECRLEEAEKASEKLIFGDRKSISFIRDSLYYPHIPVIFTAHESL